MKDKVFLLISLNNQKLRTTSKIETLPHVIMFCFWVKDFDSIAIDFSIMGLGNFSREKQSRKFSEFGLHYFCTVVCEMVNT